MLANQNSTVGGSPGEWNDLLYIGTNGYLCGAIYPPEGFCNNTSVNDGQWHNAVLTVNNSTGEDLYLDGNLVSSSSTIPGTYSASYYNQIGTGFSQSWSYTPGGWFPFKGEISNVIIYHTVLTASQIQSLFNDGINSTQAFCSPDFINSSYYRQFSDTPTEFASYSSIANNQTTTVGYALNVPATQTEGYYTNTITYTVSGDY
jgi:hypothetical protein